MKYIYGPVKSRRLKNSLGVSIIPYKVCSYDCVYCQLKKTTRKSFKRKVYFKEKEILKEITNFLEHKPKDLKIDYITFSGSGEPTLNKAIGRLIRAVRGMTSLPIVVFTNSSTLMDPEVRHEISAADLVIPSLDAVTQDVFEKIDRPHRGLRIEDVIAGLMRFRKEFKGKLWLEIMLVEGLNDSFGYLEKMKNVVDSIHPDRIQINSPVRPPAQRWVSAPGARTLKKAKEIFGQTCDVF